MGLTAGEAFVMDKVTPDDPFETLIETSLVLLEYGFDLEASTSQVSHWNEVTSEQTPHGMSLEHNLGHLFLQQECGPEPDSKATQAENLFCPFGETEDIL